jgi:hypothetical protein
MLLSVSNEWQWGHTLPEEIHYIRICTCGIPYFAPGELHKIENYNIASSQGYYGWNLHHRNGTEKSNPTGKLVKELKHAGLYYLRSAPELIFLTAKEHRMMHQSSNSVYAYDTINSSYRAALRKYNCLIRGVLDGEFLTIRDYRFIETFCYRMHRKMPQCQGSIDILELCKCLIKRGVHKKKTREGQDACISSLLMEFDIDPTGEIASDIKSALVCNPNVLSLNGGKPIMLKPSRYSRVSV